MKKIFTVFTLFAALVFVVSCGGGSKKSNGGESSNVCSYGDYECQGGVSYFCAYQDDKLTWTLSEECSDGCDEESGKCKDAEHSDNDPENPDTTPDNPDSDDPDTTPDNPDTDDADTVPDNNTDSDSSDAVPDQDTNTDTDTSELTEEGIYFGVIGFNEELYSEDIGLLDETTKSVYTSFIDSLNSADGTSLYFADYTALKEMRDFPKPPHLSNVALITFTDGLDNMSVDDYDPANYGSSTVYLNKLHESIESGMHGLPIEAYSIGLRGNDVTDTAAFSNTLNKLASSGNVYEVSDMNAVKSIFNEIAGTLHSVSKSVDLDVKLPNGYDDGQVLRFTFDNPSSAADSYLYIEATYRRPSGGGRTLDNISYHGFYPGKTEIDSSWQEGRFYHFVFEGIKYTNKQPLSDNDYHNLVLWKRTSAGGWDRESEFHLDSSSSLDESKSSALIMLVLDCTTSLGESDFAKMKTAAKEFVTTLVNGAQETTRIQVCTGLPENAQWNTASEITQTFNGSTWTPSEVGTYNETSSTSECRFKCQDGFTWNSSTYTCE